jgi:cbb3-type cytochrome oxidase subunit 3
MFKFIKQYAETIDRIEIYPMISLLIVFSFFTLLIWYVIKLDKQRVNKAAHLPLEDEPNESYAQL